MITPQNLVRHELIGLLCTVEKSTDPSQTGLAGVVVDETRNTLIIDVRGSEKTLVKEACIFVFTLPDRHEVRVQGDVLVSRPEDRIKKKLKKW